MTTVVRVQTTAALHRRLAKLAATVLDIPVDRVGVDAPLSRLGLDSVNAAELTALIEDDLGIELPPAVLFDFPTIAGVAAYIEQRDRIGFLEVPRVAARLARMRADAMLPASVTPRRTAGAAKTSRILLTGATGFVGGYLLSELLATSDADVWCLVRGRNGDDRVRANLARYRIWNPAFAPRIRCIRGDIERPSLGLDPAGFAELARGVDAIYHAAASVDWVQPYEALRDANVAGTRHLLELACTGEAKRFCFLSSLAVCYSTIGPTEVDETANPLDLLAGVHFGYAQSKSVAEALVREAGNRGLPTTIVRPALVAGDSATGASNVDDLVSLFFRGCIALGAAPDLDWAMDSVPVDFVARAIVSTTNNRLDQGVVHLLNPAARRWRECVLWMRLRGYPMTLLPYDDWAELVRRKATAPDHPLHGLRWFLLHRVPEEGGLALPQLYEESRRHRALAERSTEVLARRQIDCPPLDTHLLERFFDWYVDQGAIPSPSPARVVSARPAGDDSASRIRHLIADALGRESGARACVTDAELSRFGQDSSIVAELTSWRRATSAGVYRARVAYSLDGRSQPPLDLVVKIKTSDDDTIDVGSHVAALCGESLGAAYDQFRDHVGFTRGHIREIAIARMTDPALVEHAPRVVATWSEDALGEWGTIVELVSDATVKDADDRTWSDTEIDTALRGLAAIHGTWLGRTDELAKNDWLPPLRDSATLGMMTPLWSALADHAAPLFQSWCGPSVVERHRVVARGISSARTPDAPLPRTLIHNDFNPRNLMLRSGGADGQLRLCAYDWELATIGLPQRDLVELLCFTLDPTTAAGQFVTWAERYRTLLEEACGLALRNDHWRVGVRAALDELLVDRLAMYAMIHRFRPQRFLPRVVRTWAQIDGEVGTIPWSGR